MRIHHHPSRRAGNVLLLCALMLFVIFAIAALTIDLGLARATHRQMQTATDAAAREGLRYRDDIPAWLREQMQQNGIDPADRELVRRWMARNQVNLTYQDLIDPDTGNILAQFGAGPMYQVSGSVGAGYALQTITAPDAGKPLAYNPGAPDLDPKERLQLNLDNQPSGDFVALNAGSNPNFPAGETRDEANNFEQKNFSVADKAGATHADSFLARLRRTNDPRGNPTSRNDLDNIDGVSTTGPALPLIFGQATLIPAADAGPSFRRDGITVRGTSIAQARPVLAVGKAIAATGVTSGMAGAALFSIKQDDWLKLTTFNSAIVSFYAPLPRSLLMIGDTLTAAPAGAIPTADLNQVYVPLVDATNMIMAFGYATSDGTTVTKIIPRVASENATASTAVLVPNPGDPTIPDPATNAAVLTALSALISSTNPNQKQFLLAPALVR